MTVPVNVRGLVGAAYSAAKAKALRPAPYVAPPVAPRRAATDMSEAEYLAAKPKRIADMDLTEYAAARRDAIRASR